MLSPITINKIKKVFHKKPLVIEGANGSLGLSFLKIFKDYKIIPSKILLTTYSSNLEKSWIEFDKNIIHLKSNRSNFLLKRGKILNEFVNINVIYCSGYGRPNFFLKNPYGIIESNITNLIPYSSYKRINTFAFMSTSEIYSGLGGIIKENSILPTYPQHPRGVYIESKRLAESFVENVISKNVKRYASFRIALAFPPKLLHKDNRVLSDLINNAFDNNQVTLNGGGDFIRQYQYGPNAALKVLAAISIGKSNLYNNSGNHIIKLKDLAKMVGDILNKRVVIKKESPLDGSAPKKVLIDSTLLNSEIKYNVNLEKNLKQYLTEMITTKNV